MAGADPTSPPRRVLWWGRFDPDYSRNRILRQAFVTLGWQIADFHPRLSMLGDWECRLRRVPAPDVVFVPCFRQRDIAAAARYSRRHGVKLIIDPLISAYDKQVYERRKLPASGRRAQRLRTWESRLFARADMVLADTDEHARFFRESLGVRECRVHVVHVGAEENLFVPAAFAPVAADRALEVLFYGSFIALQGPEVIVQAARCYNGAPVRWVLLGDGPLRGACEAAARGLDDVRFEDWLPYSELPARIARAHILLGIFGTTSKAGRVIPNKLYQALACGRPVVTRFAPAYPRSLSADESRGITWVPPGDAVALARAVAQLARQPELLATRGADARDTYEKYFSASTIVQELRRALITAGAMPAAAG